MGDPVRRRRLVQAFVLAVLALGSWATEARDQQTCSVLCLSVELYCDAHGGTMDGVCSYDYKKDICTLPGCWLPRLAE
jgi:hypothetical protein